VECEFFAAARPSSLESKTAYFYNLSNPTVVVMEATMATVIVYSYTVFDQGKLIRLPSKRAADQIAQIGGQVIWETAQAVDESALRDDGRYLPKYSEEPDEGAQAAE
jgi:hypothetical protein